MLIHLLLSFFFNDTATTEIYTLSLHDALPSSAELLAVFGSGSEAMTTTRLATTPGVGGARRRIIAVAFPPLTIVPRLKITVPLATTLDPCELVAETKVRSTGKVSNRLTP